MRLYKTPSYFRELSSLLRAFSLGMLNDKELYMVKRRIQLRYLLEQI